MASPEVIRVGAVAGVLCQVPGTGSHGKQVEYIGRRTDHAAIAETMRVRVDRVRVMGDIEVCYPPDVEHNSVFGRADGASLMSALRRCMREGSAKPLDETTAAWAGVAMPAMPVAAPSAPPIAKARRASTFAAPDAPEETK